ncbi:MAG: ferritin family protein [Deltaproteobacteria bacterium]
MRVQLDKAGRIVLTDFSPVQALKIAVKMEREGIDFYLDLKQEVRDEEARREIDFLIQQEREHLQTFSGLLGSIKETQEDAFEQDDIVDYMNTRVFDASQEKKAAEAMGHRHTALEEALDRERRSIVFYEGCLARTTDPGAQKAFERILAEENSHLKKFGELLRVKCIDGRGPCLL